MSLLSMGGRPLLSRQDWSLLADQLQLSSQQVLVLRGLMNDKPEAQIASEMGISANTVHTHVRRAYQKLGVTSRCAAVARVFEEYLKLARAASASTDSDRLS